MTPSPAGARHSSTGIFGPQTRSAVEAYQRMLGLPVTGAVDRATWNALVSTYRSVLLVQPEQEWLGLFVGLPEVFPRHRHARRRRAAGAGAHQHHRAAIPRCLRSRWTAFSAARPRVRSPSSRRCSVCPRPARRSADLGGDGAAGRRCRGVLAFCRRAVSRLRAQ